MSKTEVCPELNSPINNWFCITEGGYIGVVSTEVVAEDLIAIVFGVPSPCVIGLCLGCDTAKASHSCYHHVGVSCVHGMMKREKVKVERGINPYLCGEYVAHL